MILTRAQVMAVRKDPLDGIRSVPVEDVDDARAEFKKHVDGPWKSFADEFASRCLVDESYHYGHVPVDGAVADWIAAVPLLAPLSVVERHLLKKVLCGDMVVRLNERRNGYAYDLQTHGSRYVIWYQMLDQRKEQFQTPCISKPPADPEKRPEKQPTCGECATQ